MVTKMRFRRRGLLHRLKHVSFSTLFSFVSTKIHGIYRRIRFPNVIHPALDFLRTFDTQYPFGLVFEPTNRCNAACTFCPVSKRDKGFKTSDLTSDALKKVEDHLKSLPVHSKGFVQPIGLGEPTIARNFPEILHRLRAAAPRNFTILLNTNGQTLNSSRIRSAILKYVDNLTISINGWGRKQYSDLNGVDAFDAVVANTREFLREKNGGDQNLPITRLQLMRSKGQDSSHSDGMENEFQELMGEFDRFHIQPLMTLAGVEDSIRPIQVSEDVEREMDPKFKSVPCFQVWYQAFVAADGDVYPCCIVGNVDGSEKRRDTGLLIGNVNEESVEEIWKGKRRKEILRSHVDGDKPEFCKACTAVSMYGIDDWNRLIENSRIKTRLS